MKNTITQNHYTFLHTLFVCWFVSLDFFAFAFFFLVFIVLFILPAYLFGFLEWILFFLVSVLLLFLYVCFCRNSTLLLYFCCLLVVACGGEAARRSVTRRIYASLRSIDSIERTLYYWKYRKKNNKHYQRKSENKERTQFNRNLKQTRVTIAYTLHYESERGRDNWRAISTIEFEQLKLLLLY